MALEAQEQTNAQSQPETASKTEEFKSDVKDAIEETIAIAVEKFEDARSWKEWIVPGAVGLLLLLAPLTIYKTIPYLKAQYAQTQRSSTEVNSVGKVELDAIYDRVRALSQIAATEPAKRKAALDERAELIARVKTASDTQNFNGASDLALEWVNRIKNDLDVPKKGAVIVKPKPKAPESKKADKVEPVPQVKEAPKKIITPDKDEAPKCSLNDTNCGDWKNRIFQ